MTFNACISKAYVIFSLIMTSRVVGWINQEITRETCGALIDLVRNLTHFGSDLLGFASYLLREALIVLLERLTLLRLELQPLRLRLRQLIALLDGRRPYLYLLSGCHTLRLSK